MSIITSLAILLILFPPSQPAQECSHAPPKHEQDKQVFEQGDGYCYVLVASSKKNQSDASIDCRTSYAGFLMRTSEPRQLAIVTQHLQNNNSRNIWIDIYCDLTKQICTWSNCKPISPWIYAVGHHPLHHQCGALLNERINHRFYTWNTLSCASRHNYICQTPAIYMNSSECGPHLSFLYRGSCYVIIEKLQVKTEAKSCCGSIGGTLVDLRSDELIIAATNFLSLNNWSSTPDVWVHSVFQPERFKGALLLTKRKRGIFLLDKFTGWNFFYPHQTATGFPFCRVVAQNSTGLDSGVSESLPTTSRINVVEEAIKTMAEHKISIGTISAVVSGVTVAFVVIILVLIHYKQKSRRNQRIESKKRSLPSKPEAAEPEMSFLPTNFLTPIKTSESVAGYNRSHRPFSSKASAYHSYQQIAFDENTYASIASYSCDEPQELEIRSAMSQKDIKKKPQETKDPCSLCEFKLEQLQQLELEKRSKHHVTNILYMETGTEKCFCRHSTSTSFAMFHNNGENSANPVQMTYAELLLNSDEEQQDSSDSLPSFNRTIHYADLLLEDEENCE